MRKQKLLPIVIAVLATVGAIAQESQPYSPSLRPVKQVVKSSGKSTMLKPKATSKVKSKAIDASQFQGLTIYANLTNSDDWADYGIASVPYGIYSYTIGSDNDFQPLATSLSYNFMASAMGRDQLVGVRAMEMLGNLNGAEYIGLSAGTYAQLWSKVYDEPGNYSLIPSVMAYNLTNDKFYSIQYNTDLTGLNLAQWNPSSKAFDIIAAWNNSFQPMAMAFDPKGTLYCIGSDATLYTINLENANASKIAALDLHPTMYVQGMGYEPSTASLVWMAVAQEGSGLYAINPATGESTLIKELTKNEQSPTVFFEGSRAPAQAPAASTDLKFNFNGGATDGTLDFTVPTTTYSGEALNDNVTMTVWIDGNVVINGTSVAPGSKQSIEVNLSNDNHYAYVLYHNDGGYSPACYVYSYAGYDIPLPVTNLNLLVNNGESLLSWTAPTAGVNGGYLGNITYNVTRMPGSVNVAQGISATEFTETLPDKMERYYYEVTPFNGADKQGETATSNAVLTGTAFAAPYFDDFSDSSTQSLWTIVNANNDASSYGSAYTWQFNNNICSINTSSYNMGTDVESADDYLISPAVSLETGISYALIVNMTNTFSNYKERVSLLMGTDPTDVSTFTELARNEAFDTGGKLTNWESDFMVDQAGSYYFAVRVFTNRNDNGSGVTVNSLAVNILGKDNAPAEATNLQITPEPTGELQAILTFTTPSKSLNGEDLTGNLSANIYRDNKEKVLATIPVTAGASTSWTDNSVDGVGVHSYTIAIANEAGEGKRVTASAFIGVYTPPYTNTFDTSDDANLFVTVNDSSIYSTNEYRWIWNSYDQKLSLGGYGYFVQHPVEKIWLFMPAVKLEKDMVYSYAFNWTYSSYDKSCPAYAGVGMAPDSIAQTIYAEQLPFTDYGVKTPVTNEIIATETGKYYPSILVVADKLYAYASPSIDDLSITVVGSSYAPYSIENLSLKNDETGALKAYFKFNAPTVDYAQRPLQREYLKVYIMRSGSTIPIATFSNVAPGQELQWTDEQPLKGNNSYTIVAENSYGRGKVTEASVFVGVDLPAMVENLRIRGNEDNQKAIITWDPTSSVGVNGGVIDESLVYNIYEYIYNDDGTYQVTPLGSTTETAFTVERKPTTEMEQHVYGVVPKTSAGEGTPALENVVLGQLKQLPFAESFAGAGVSASGWLVNTDGASYGTTWYLLNDDDEMTSQDGDNGYALCYNGNYSSACHWADLVTPKMLIDPSKSYLLSFYVYTGVAPTSATVAPTLVVSQSNDDYDYNELQVIDVTSGEPQWTLFELPISNVNGNFMKFAFRGNMSNVYERIWLDNISIKEQTPDAIDELQLVSKVTSTPQGISFNGMNGEQVSIYTVDGRLIHSMNATGSHSYNLAPGIYIVTINSKTLKIRVK